MNRLAAALALAAATLAGAHGLALAHGPDAIFDPLTMDSHTPVSTLNVDFAYVAYEEPPNADITVMGFTLSGQYVTPQGFGGYLSLPLSYLSGQNVLLGLADDSELAIGNLELGGLWSKYLTAHAAIVLHAGFALPTAADEGIAFFQSLASSPRYGNLVQRVPNSSWFRMGVSPMGRAGKLFWRADVGLDLALEEDDSDLSPIFRINVGGGIDLGSAHLLVELVTNVVDDGRDDDSASTLAIGARFLSGNLRPGFGLLIPIDFDGLLFEPDFAITASLAVRL
ncbi:MAG TPA: hypothetical protein VK932_29810 [Kofleriaceae bacterium]|nr:hypothetical protein [Kofleriaceae bacterium]